MTDVVSDFQDLGVGVGLRPPHFSLFLKNPPSSVSWVEVVSENFMDGKFIEAGFATKNLEKVRQNLPVILHGVSMNLGSVDPLDRDYLKKLKKLVDQIQPAWISDHLCWTGVEGVNSHDLLPLPYTEEVLNWVARKIQRVQDFLKRRILIENPSTYLQFAQSDLTEWEFMNELARKADCGILLDVNNIFVSSVNHSFDPMRYLGAIARERVGQIHLAGHSVQDNHRIDTHDAPVCDEVWGLYEEAVKKFGKKSTMLERDANIPEWEEMERELFRIKKIRDEGTPSWGLSTRPPSQASVQSSKRREFK